MPPFAPRSFCTFQVGAYIGGKRGGGRIHEMSEERKHQNREREGVVEEEDLGEEGEEQDETAELAEEGMEGEERGHGRQPQ